jgi:hypothetical protein
MEVKWPEEAPKKGLGMFWCQVGKKIYVKNSWSVAKKAGVVSGMEVVKVNRQPVLTWLNGYIGSVSELTSFSTAHQASFYACHWALKWNWKCLMLVGVERN